MKIRELLTEFQTALYKSENSIEDNRITRLTMERLLELLAQREAALDEANKLHERHSRPVSDIADMIVEAGIMRCLASSPRFQKMTVAEALAELAENGQGMKQQ